MVPLKAIGLMSGTVLDGVAATLLETDDITLSYIGPTIYRPCSRSGRDLLRQALADASALLDRRARPGGTSPSRTSGDPDAHRSHRNRDHRVPWSDRAPSARFRACGAGGPGLARRLGISVTCACRAADMAAGGGGDDGDNIPSRACRDARLAATGRPWRPSPSRGQMPGGVVVA
jgi:anhydro-N-acetylmuramic acid kinase